MEMGKFTPPWTCLGVFIGLHLSSLRIFTICPGLRGKSPSVLSAVHLNKPSRRHEVSRGERPCARLTVTGELQPGDAANGTGRCCGAAARRLWPSTLATTADRGCGRRGTGKWLAQAGVQAGVPAGVPAHTAPRGSKYSESTAGVFEKS